MKYAGIREEELKNKVAQEYFWQYDCTKIIGNVDFCVSIRHSGGELFEQESLMWAEAKAGKSDIYKSLVQLILTIGKARTFDRHLPPPYLGAFDAENIAFIPYNDIHDIFYQNDFNWNVTPSNHESKEFKLVLDKVKSIIERNALLYSYETDEKELQKFIKANFIVGKFGITKIKIDKNNFMVIYNKWLSAVKPSIAVNWDTLKSNDIIDGDFYLADLLSLENETLKDKLFVLLKQNRYELARTIDESGLFNSKRAEFIDEQKAHNQFWNKYERPPKEEYWDYIIERRDLLVPQDVRERKGSFFTPQIWVELSQKYLTDALGEDWQDEYYIWDCAAGTGNLLTGLTNKYNVWASTLDRQDVDVMKDRIKNGANLLEDHVFQFDFLNDEFDKLPAGLQSIINDPEKRKKLVMYINPPYAEATTARTVTGTGENKAGVATNNKMNDLFKAKIGNASNEIFALFMAKIYDKLPESKLGQFSTLKFVQGTNFNKFKDYFKAKYLGGFVVPGDTFDNVRGKFPIGFTIWDLDWKEKIIEIECDVYHNNKYNKQKTFYANLPQSINKWFVKYQNNSKENIGLLSNYPPDFQNQNKVFIQINQMVRSGAIRINSINLMPISIYFSVRLCIDATWLNDRDQFLYPNDGWSTDAEFQNDCLAFALFHGQNKISSKEGTNHWIPFTEQEVDAREKFESNFMTQYIKGKLGKDGLHTGKDVPHLGKDVLHLADVGHLNEIELFQSETNSIQSRTTPLEFSPEALNVFEAGRKLWRYYHKCIKTDNNLSQTLSKGEGFKNGNANLTNNLSQAISKGEGFKNGNANLTPSPSGRAGVGSNLAGVGSPYPSVNASLYDIREYFQGRNDKGKMNNKSDDMEYMELIKDLRDSLKLLAKKIEPKVYEYGFLKA